MAVPKHLEESVANMKAAAFRIDQARAKPPSAEVNREWLAALTDFTAALSEVQEYNNESVHEKLHELAARAGLRQFPTGSAKGS